MDGHEGQRATDNGTTRYKTRKIGWVREALDKKYYSTISTYNTKKIKTTKKNKLENSNLSSSSNPINNNFNKFHWIGFIIVLTFLFFSSYFYIKSILFVYILIIFSYTIFLVMDLFIFLFFISHKFNTPLYLPYFIRNWLINKENIAGKNIKYIRVFLALDLRNLSVYVIILILMLIIYINI